MLLMANPKPRPTRTAGILLHPTSLPGPFGIGDLGPTAHAWIDALARAKQTWWQILPLGPTGYGDSPYQCYSAFAGNPSLISPELLVGDGLLTTDDLGVPQFPADRVDSSAVAAFKTAMLDRAWEHFRAVSTPLKPAFEQFTQENAAWLDDYALFMALKDGQGGASWQDWPAPVRLRQPAALASARTELRDRIGRHQFRQFLFTRQWVTLRDHARQRGVRIIGDAPIFVAGDSADVWANPHLFLLDAQGRQTALAGVPPDYFSPTGQLWGNPLYDWAAARRDGYRWWVARVRAALAQVDLLRLDHFRGFAAAWHIPAGDLTAEKGKWVDGPGADLFASIQRELGGLPLIAEDLGLITPDVELLRDQFALPGMSVLQFAFSDPHNKYLPHNYANNTVVYTGTHDNDTTRGWFSGLSDTEKHFVRSYLSRDGGDIAWDLMRLAWSSVGDLAIAPLQDVLDLGREARMNTPGVPTGNWSWRVGADAVTAERWDRLTELTELFGRS
jgi:4-alpha-glucanotransferase